MSIINEFNTKLSSKKKKEKKIYTSTITNNNQAPMVETVVKETIRRFIINDARYLLDLLNIVNKPLELLK